MIRTKTQEIKISVDHVEEALIEYIKRYFAEATEVTGLTITMCPSDKDSLFKLQVTYKTNVPASEPEPEPVVVPKKKVKNVKAVKKSGSTTVSV